MGNFIISLVLVSIIVIFICFNCFYISSVCDDILALIDQNEFQEACEIWNRSKNYISIFVRDSEIDIADSNIEDFSESGNEYYIEVYFRQSVLEIKDSEVPIFINIF